MVDLSILNYQRDPEGICYVPPEMAVIAPGVGEATAGSRAVLGFDEIH
jgi:hypothetical protein